jgi:hypothetical protein
MAFFSSVGNIELTTIFGQKTKKEFYELNPGAFRQKIQVKEIRKSGFRCIYLLKT